MEAPCRPVHQQHNGRTSMFTHARPADDARPCVRGGWPQRGSACAERPAAGSGGDPRHTAACLWLALRIDPGTVHAWCGHESIATTD